MWLPPMQARWLGHLYHASSTGQTLSAYAKAQGLPLSALLSWEQQLAVRGIAVPPRHRPDRFVAVRVPA